MAQAGDITRLLQDAEKGDRDAVDRLFCLVEEDLKAIARKRKRSAPAGLDASTTMLVDDAFLRLVGRQASTWEAGDRCKFFGYASKKIHEMLIKAARADGAAKRGGGRRRETPEECGIGIESADNDKHLAVQLDLKDALDRFECFAPQEAMLFRIRYFLGCTFEEAANVLGLSTTEAKRTYERARLWLEGQLKEYDLDA